MTEPRRGAPSAPRFGYTVDETLLPHRRVPRPMAILVAMALLPVVALLGLAAIAMPEPPDFSVEIRIAVQAATWLVIGTTILEVLLWRGLAESRVVVLAFAAAGTVYEGLILLLKLRALGLGEDRHVPAWFPVALAALALVQLLAVAGLVAALCRRDVGVWFKAVRRSRFERRGHLW